MKKLFFFLSAIALLGLTAACVEQIQVNNPNYDAEKGEVKAEFLINFATTAQTKALATDVQANENFRGMDAVALYMSKGYGSAYLGADYQPKLGTMQPLYGASKLDVAGITATNSRRVYKLNMPIGVDNMVFYAKAKAGDAASNNKTTYNVTTNKKTTFFQLEAIKADADFTSGNPKAILDILNSFSTTLINKWSATDDVTLATAFTNYFTTEETLRQASGKAVLRTMQDLYNLVKDADENAENLTLKGEIKKAILGVNNANFSNTNDILAYKTDELNQFPEDLGLPVGVAQVKCNWSTTTPSLPTSFAWVNPSNTIANELDSDGEVLVNNAINFQKIMYPAELCYWADSPIRVSNTEGVVDDTNTETNYYPNGALAWDDEAKWTNATGNWLAWATNKAVTKDTRAVALKSNVLYGVALAKTSVQMAQVTDNKFSDNRNKLRPNLADQEIVIDGTEKYFRVTGILFGGQPNMVGWNFVADPTDSNNPYTESNVLDRTRVIYDHVFDSYTIPNTDAPFYTMVFDNYKPVTSNEKQDVVYFALELENHAGDFYGLDNVIYDGGKFYLTGKLDLADANTTDYSELSGALEDLQKLNYRIPPVSVSTTTDGVTNVTMNPTPRIFVQDFTTEINITLGANVLKHAYATIPDLRPVDMYFGLSVDLKWKTGTTVNVVL